MRSLSIFFFTLTTILFPQDRTVTFVSNPERCQVYINGSLRGITPYTATIADTTDHHLVALRFEREGYLRKSFKSLIEDLCDTVNITLHRTAALSVTTVPSDASVFIDSVFYGRTPFHVDTLNGRTMLVTVVKKYHSVFSEQITLESGSDRTISTTLEQLRSSLLFNANISGITFSIDGQPVEDPHQLSDVPFGSHILTANDPATGNTAEQIVVIETKDPKVLRARLNEFSLGKITRGILIPSLNQFEDKKSVKAQVIASAAIASLLFYSYSEFNYRSAEKEFKSAQDEYSHRSNSIPLASDARARMEEKHDELTSALSTLNIARFLPLAVWGLNAIDVVLHHSVVNIIEDVSKSTSFRFDASDRQWSAEITIPL